MIVAQEYGCTAKEMQEVRPLGAGAFGAVVGHAEHLAETRVIPHLVVPIHEALQARG